MPPFCGKLVVVLISSCVRVPQKHLNFACSTAVRARLSLRDGRLGAGAALRRQLEPRPRDRGRRRRQRHALPGSGPAVSQQPSGPGRQVSCLEGHGPVSVTHVQLAHRNVIAAASLACPQVRDARAAEDRAVVGVRPDAACAQGVAAGEAHPAAVRGAQEGACTRSYPPHTQSNNLGTMPAGPWRGQ